MKIITGKLWVTFSLLFCGIAFSVINPLRHFTVTEIAISGNDRIGSTEIVKRSGIRAEETSILFSASEAKQAIMDNTWIEDVSIRKLLHGKIEITVLEQKPFCIVAPQGEKPYYVGKNGKNLGEVDARYGLDFPLISSNDEIKENMLLQAIEILYLSRSSSVLGWEEISEIVVQKNTGIRLLTTDRRLINFGKDNMTSKWRKVERIIVHTREKNLVEKDIDISSGDMGVISYDS